MAESVFKHLDDQGDLSMFASGAVLIVSCSNGHYWVVEGTYADSKADAGQVLSEKVGLENAAQVLELM
jgi:hypothetical protein